ncbi:hypothetical protein ADL28_31955 [Streptomyces violaceusniger]|uniref:Uncharacterized protein n=1 Tax=Streptomyces violaceusniger TaxID=68280 RepID=A0A0X3VTM6_STRVO|nr:hypothetical protein ADL28_31955 [Streptomyces violaceusniger]
MASLASQSAMTARAAAAAEGSWLGTAAVAMRSMVSSSRRGRNTVASQLSSGTVIQLSRR